MYYVYILQSKKDRRLYIGMTNDLKRRFLEHEMGKVKSTIHRRPLTLLAYEAYARKDVAGPREKYLKSSDGHKDIYRRLQINVDKV